MTGEEFDKIFDDNQEDVIPYLDLTSARRPGREVRRVNVDFPVWMIESLDQEATRIGVPRQAIIKLWIAQRLDHIGRPGKSLKDSNDRT